MDAGRELFTERGAAAVSAEQIVARAGVTRGALYHHFRDKNDLFRAVFEELEERLCAELAALMDARPTAVEGLLAAVTGFLDAARRPEVHRIGLVDAPAVLGWARWREIEARYGLGLLTDRLRAAEAEGAVLTGPPEVLAQLALGLAIEAALMIAASDRPEWTRARVESTLSAVAAGLVSGAPGDRPM